MTDNVRLYLQLGDQECNKIESASGLGAKSGAFTNASAYYTQAMKAGELDAEALGLLGFFYIEYSMFLRSEFGDKHGANAQYVLAFSLFNRALEKDPHELFSRVFMLASALNDLPIRTEGGGIGKWLIELSDYNRQLKVVTANIEKMAAAFNAKLSPGNSVETALEIIGRVINVIDLVNDSKVDFTPIYRAFMLLQTAPNGVKIYVETDEEEQEVLLQVAQRMVMVKARLEEVELRRGKRK